MIKINIVEDIGGHLRTQKDILRRMTGEASGKRWGTKKILTLTPKQFSSVFSPERLRLLRTLKTGSFDSISELAEHLQRPYEAVHRDLAYLTGLGLAKVEAKRSHHIPLLGEDVSVPALV